MSTFPPVTLPSPRSPQSPVTPLSPRSPRSPGESQLLGAPEQTILSRESSNGSSFFVLTPDSSSSGSPGPDVRRSAQVIERVYTVSQPTIEFLGFALNVASIYTFVGIFLGNVLAIQCITVLALNVLFHHCNRQEPKRPLLTEFSQECLDGFSWSTKQGEKALPVLVDLLRANLLPLFKRSYPDGISESVQKSICEFIGLLAGCLELNPTLKVSASSPSLSGGICQKVFFNLENNSSIHLPMGSIELGLSSSKKIMLDYLINSEIGLIKAHLYTLKESEQKPFKIKLGLDEYEFSHLEIKPSEETVNFYHLPQSLSEGDWEAVGRGPSPEVDSIQLFSEPVLLKTCNWGEIRSFILDKLSN